MAYILVPGLEGQTHMLATDAIIGATESLDTKGATITLNHPAAVLVVNTTLGVHDIVRLIDAANTKS